MKTEKIIKYSVPVFALSIISRSIEEISFLYYAVPVMSVFFIVLLLISSRFNSLPRIYFGVKRQRSNVKDTSTSLSVTNPLVSSIQYPDSEIRNPTSGIWFLMFLIPGLWFLLTTLWSSYPEVSASRALYFILISVGCISAGTLWLRYSQKGLFDFLLPANIFIVLLCLFSIITNIPSDSWTGGHGKGFMGFFGHQNLLASVLLFTLPSVFHRVVIVTKSRIRAVITIDSRRTSFAGMTDADEPSFRLRSESDGKNDTSYTSIQHPVPSIPMIIACCLLLTANFLLLSLTYSRSAILSFIFGVIVFLILSKKWKVILYSIGAAAVISIIIYFTPTLNDPVDKILKKDFPEIYSSRIWMWEPSYKAALEGGLFGLGYGISHPEIRSGEYSDRFENGRLVREKGNSSLALIEEAGLIGLILFLIPIFYILFKVIFKKDPLLPTTYSLLSAALAAFLLHAQFEAWWVGVGSVQLPLFFIFLGLTAHQASSTEIKT